MHRVTSSMMISSLIVVQLSLSSLMAQIFAQEGGGGYLQYILCVWIILNFKNFCKVKSINSFSDYLKMIKKKKKKKKLSIKFSKWWISFRKI